MTDTKWTIAGVSAIGSAHIAAGKPCEDFHILSPSHVDDDWQIACIADGAGSVPYGKDGAVRVCEHFVTYISRCRSEGMDLEGLSKESAEEWLETYRRDLQQWAEQSQTRVHEYACTFLAVVIGEGSAVFIQIGDGAIVVRGSEARQYNVIFWPVQGEYANQTTFVTSETAIECLQHMRVSQPDIDAVALFTDGLQRLCLDYLKKAAHAPFFEKMFRRLKDFPSGEVEQFSDELQSFLLSDTVMQRTDDDKTIVLAISTRFE